MKDFCLKIECAQSHETKQGRWSFNSTNLYMTFMVKENQKFVQWVLPFLLNMLANELNIALYNIGILLVDKGCY
jgi:hypothetical protein